MDRSPNANEAYLTACADEMKRTFDGVVVITILCKGDPVMYPDGAWFDGFVGSTMDIAGVDLSANPNVFITADGSSMPMSCAEIVKIVRPGQS